LTTKEFDMTTRQGRGVGTVAMLLVLTALAGPATASHWCGENGVIRLVFAVGDSLSSVANVTPGEHGLTEVELQAWLEEVEPVAIEDEAFLSIGGYEFQLVVEGAEVMLKGHQLADGAVNLVNTPLTYLVGMQNPLEIVDGRALLGTWQLLIQGEAENVRITVAPEGVHSCADCEGCAGSGTRGLYVGSIDSGQISDIFGAGCVPAWLNPTDEPDLTPLRGDSAWQDVRRAAPRQKRF
jgi:hypothetical protein